MPSEAVDGDHGHVVRQRLNRVAVVMGLDEIAPVGRRATAGTDTCDLRPAGIPTAAQEPHPRLAWTPGIDPAEFERASHGEAWGCAYSRVWRAHEEFIREVACRWCRQASAL